MTAKTVIWSFFQSGWTPELAWWLGVLLGDGNIYYAKRWRTRVRKRIPSYTIETIDASLSAVGTESTMRNWFRLFVADAEPQEMKRHSGLWNAYIAQKDLVEFVMDRFGFDGGEKASKLKWPEDLPKELHSHFIRGLWDTDGHLGIYLKKQGKGNTTVLAKFGVKTRSFVETLSRTLAGDLGIAEAPVYPGASIYNVNYRSDVAVQVASFLYETAPVYLRNEIKYQKFLELAAVRLAVKNKVCIVCGDKAAKDDKCYAHWYAARENNKVRACIQCNTIGVKAKGLCLACYFRKRRANPEFNRKSTGVCICGKPSFRKGKCDACYLRARRNKSAGAELDDVNRLIREMDVTRSDFVKQVVTLIQGVSLEQPTADILYNESFVASVVAGAVSIDNGELTVTASPKGQQLCRLFLGDAMGEVSNSLTGFTMKEAVTDCRLLERAVRFQLRYGSARITTKTILRALRYITKAPTNMSPVLARWIMQRYGKPGGQVFDPCAGFGGRLLGAVAAGMSYVAIDANPAVISGLMKFIEHLGQKAPTLRLFAMQGKSENIDGWIKSDLVFTSPPYFNAEKYKGKDQSANSYPTYTEWREGFLAKIISNAADTLRPGGKLVLVVRDVKRGDYLYPIEKDTVDFATAQSFVLEESLAIKLPGRKSRPDRLLAFRLK